MKQYQLFAALGLSILAQAVQSNPLDKVLQQNSESPQHTQAGKIVFEQACAACHGKALGGGAGFNLKDGEWIHGEAPSAILANIKQGFNRAGMPAFGAIYSEQQLQDVVAYILSKREGLANLTYKIYALDSRGDTELSASKLVKTGRSSTHLMNFELPETEYYAIEFEGDLYAPSSPSKLFIDGWIPTPIKVTVDGQLVERTGKRAVWPLKAGKQTLNFQFIVNAPIKQHWQKDLALFVTNRDLGIKHFSLSNRGQRLMNDKKVHIEANRQVRVQRKKIRGLPTYSISVGFPQKINYAFNSRSCNIVGLWTGDLLNVGPNVEGRGKDSGLILGDWLLNEQYTFTQQHSQSCDYKKMQKGERPTFFYTSAGIDYSLSTADESPSGITFIYQVLNNPKQQLSQFSLPMTPHLKVTTEDGELDGETLSFSAALSTFSIRLTKQN